MAADTIARVARKPWESSANRSAPAAASVMMNCGPRVQRRRPARLKRSQKAVDKASRQSSRNAARSPPATSPRSTRMQRLARRESQRSRNSRRTAGGARRPAMRNCQRQSTGGGTGSWWDMRPRLTHSTPDSFVKFPGRGPGGDLPCERDSKSLGIHQVVGLAARRRMVEITVAHRDIPVQPFRQLGGRADVKVHAVRACGCQVVEHAEALHQRGGGGQFETVLVAPVDFGRFLRQRSAEARPVEIAAAQQVEPAALRLEGVPAETSAQHESQVQVLELVEFVIVEDVDEEARVEIMIVPDAAAHRPRGFRVGAVNQSRRLNRVEVKHSLVGIGDAGGGDTDKTMLYFNAVLVTRAAVIPVVKV